MSGFICECVKFVAEPLRTLFVDKIVDYYKFIKSCDANMTALQTELENLSSKKLEIDEIVMDGKPRLQVPTTETKYWLRSLHELIERPEMKNLMKKDEVAEIVVKMMEQPGIKKLLKDDKETFGIVVRVVKGKCSLDLVDDADYKKIAEAVREVMDDTAEEFKKFVKEGDGAGVAVELLKDDVLEMLRKNDYEMAKALSKAEQRKELEHNHHEKLGCWRKYIESLKAFLDDENFKKSLPDGAKIGLEVMLALRASPGDEPTVESAKEHRCCGCCVARFNYYRNHHDMSEAADAMIKKIKAMIERYPSGTVTRPKRTDEMETISAGFMEGLKSREELIQKLLTALRDDRVTAVGIFGMGGAGKTTLAKELANKRAVDLFDKRVVVEVSEASNIKVIQNQIAVGINSSALNNVDNVNQRAIRLHDALKSQKDKKILIILDNVWKKLNLDEVGIPRDRTKDSCCKILITTRERQVCGVMDIENANRFEAGLLNDREALSLFENKIGKEVDGEGYKPMVDRLLRKCGGLPLAIVAAASALRGKDVSMWRRFVEESEKPISSQVSSEYRETYSILETSYKLMENEEKRMFFYLACLSPLDSAISVDDLMRYGIGLDLFQHVNNLPEAMKQASEWVDELVSSSLLLKGDVDGEVRIHDVVRASAISFVEKGKDYKVLVESIPRWMCKETFKKFAAISLLSGHDFSRLSGVKAPMLQILLLKGDLSSRTLSSNFFQGMRDLKVLSLSNINFTQGLPTSIELLERLKTLHLHNCKLKDIKLIGKLGNLLVLSLRESSFEELPNEIGELCNLRLLDIRGCDDIINIPGNILSRLSYLEGLYMSDGFNNWASMKTEAGGPRVDNKASVSELNKLNHLNVLEMRVSDAEQLLTLNNDQLIEKLENFRIRVSHHEHSVDGPASRRILRFDGIDPSLNKFLKALLKKTTALTVYESGIENFVPHLDDDDEGFKDLINLEADGCNDVKYIISPDNHNESSAFVNLEILELSDMEKLEMICDGTAPTRSFSNLRRLALYGLPKLTYGLPLTLLPLKLDEVTIEGCESLKYFIVDENVSMPSEENNVVAKKDTDIIEFQYLKSININEVPSVKSVLGRAESIDDAGQPFFHEKCAFPSLEKLNLDRNETIVTLWSKTCYVSSFQNLKDITIDECQEIQSLGSPLAFAALVQLEKLDIRRCDKLQEVITEETEEHELREHVIVLPKLKYLGLHQLTSLESFSRGSYKLEFPMLESLRIFDTPSLTNFATSENSYALFCGKCAFPSLETLRVVKCTEVVMLWSKSCLKLRTLIVENCGELQSLGSPSIFAELIHLEELSISKCHKLQEVITTETAGPDQLRDHIIVFPKLKFLFLEDLSNLQCFYGGSSKLEFPMLKALSLSRTYNSIDFRKSENLTTLLSRESVFPSLECLKLCHNQTIVTLFSEACHVSGLRYLKDVEISNCPELRTLGSPFVLATLMQQLERLSIDGCDKLEEVIPKETEGDKVRERIIVCSRLKKIYMHNLSNLQTFYKGSCKLKFPKLKRLRLLHIIKLANFVGSESSTALFSDQIEFPCLKELEVCRVSNKAMSLWNWSASDEQGKVIPNSLEILKISECENMEMIIMDKDKVVGDIEGHVYEFAGLKSLKFTSLPKFICFAYAPIVAVRFPSLESFELKSCIELQSFCSGPFQAPKLNEIIIKDCNNMEYFLSGRMNNNIQELPSLESVSVENCQRLLSFSCGPLATPKLNEVSLSKCPKIKWFLPGGPENGDVLELPSLLWVSISECSDMHLFSPGQIKAPQLRILEVNDISFRSSNEELQPLLQNLHLCTTREIEEDT